MHSRKTGCWRLQLRVKRSPRESLSQSYGVMRALASLKETIFSLLFGVTSVSGAFMNFTRILRTARRGRFIAPTADLSAPQLLSPIHLLRHGSNEPDSFMLLLNATRQGVRRYFTLKGKESGSIQAVTDDAHDRSWKARTMNRRPKTIP